jgi:hypothetical protein
MEVEKEENKAITKKKKKNESAGQIIKVYLLLISPLILCRARILTRLLATLVLDVFDISLYRWYRKNTNPQLKRL